MRRDYESYVGSKFGKLTIEKASKQGSVWYFYCRCDCGNHTLVDSRNLFRGRTLSCGCIRRSSSGLRRIPDGVVKEILRLRVSGLSLANIARRVGFSRSTIFNYCSKCSDTIEQLKSFNDTDFN